MRRTTFGGLGTVDSAGVEAGKLIVFGIVKRNAFCQGDADRRPQPGRSDASHPGPYPRERALYSTDEWQAYAILTLRGEHEGFWSYAKNWLYLYRGIPSKYFILTSRQFAPVSTIGPKI